jgi:hypothetical protein
MTRKFVIAAAALLAAIAQPASAQGGRHPLVGTWRVECAGPIATASEPVTGVLTIVQRGDRLVATLQTPSARSEKFEVTHRLRGVVVGDQAQFTYTAPMRIESDHGSVLRETEVRWLIGVRNGTLTGSQLRVVPRTSEMFTETSVTGTRIGG